jgi:WD40 repeat protein
MGNELCRLSGSGQGVHGVAFSPDCRRILSGDADGTMRLWDLHTKKLLRRFEGHGQMVASVSFHRRPSPRRLRQNAAAMDVAEAGGYTQVAGARRGDSGRVA